MEAIQKELTRLGHDQEQISESMRRIAMNGSAGRVAEYIILFQYDLDRDAVKRVMTEFRAIAYDLLPETPRTVMIRTAAGEEAAAMETATSLPFVETTALIARLSE